MAWKPAGLMVAVALGAASAAQAQTPLPTPQALTIAPYGVTADVRALVATPAPTLPEGSEAADAQPFRKALEARRPLPGPAAPPSPPAAVLAASPPPTVVASFAGIRQDNVPMGGIPPDTQLAAGPSHLFEVVNLSGRIFTKTGEVVATFDLYSFFQLPYPGLFLTDPRIRFDLGSGRWFISIAARNDTATAGSWRLAVSASSDPAGPFTLYAAAPPGSWPDMPGLGITDDKIIQTAGAWRSDGTALIELGIEFVVWSKADLLAGRPATAQYFPPPQACSCYSVQPAYSLSPTSAGYVAGYQGSSLRLWVLTGVPGVGAGVATQTVDLPLTAPIPGEAGAPQPGTPALIDTGGEEFLDAVFRSGELWLAGNRWCAPPGDTTRSCLHFVQVLTGNLSIGQHFEFGTPGAYLYYPAIQLDSANNLIAVFNRSSATEFASVWVTGRLASDPPKTVREPVLVKAGESSYVYATGPWATRNRWGDYSGAGIDPGDQSAVWVAGEYALAQPKNSWGTWIGQLRFATAMFTLTAARVGTGSGTVTSAPAGVDCGGVCGASFASGTPITLTASAAPGSTFTGWSGGGCGGTGQCTLTLTANTSISAGFSVTPPSTFKLQVTKQGAGTGTVTSAPAGIDCGGACGASFASGTPVTLTPSAAPGATFTGWNGGGCSGTGPCTLNLVADTAVTAGFSLGAPTSFSLSVLAEGAGSGTVTSSPPGIQCGATCAASFPSGTVVTLTATPAPGSLAAGWSGGPCGGLTSCTLTMIGDATLTASFVVVPAGLVTVGLNQTGFSPGQTLLASAGLNDPGLPALADFYLGVLFPDGDTVVLLTNGGASSTVANLSDLTTFRPLVAGSSLAAPLTVTVPHVLVQTWAGGEPAGGYVLFLAAVLPGGLADGVLAPQELLGLATVPFVFTP